MAKGYEDLSRRALIKLGKDYDQENEAALLQFLAEHCDEYEDVRMVEKVIEKADSISQSVKNTGNTLKNVVAKEASKIIDSVMDSLSDMASGV